jgi:hypothetical protein
MSLLKDSQFLLRAVVVVAFGVLCFGIVLPNVGPFPELMPEAGSKKQAESLEVKRTLSYLIGFALAAGWIWIGWRRKSRWELLGWVLLVILTLFPAIRR